MVAPATQPVIAFCRKTRKVHDQVPCHLQCPLSPSAPHLLQLAEVCQQHCAAEAQQALIQSTVKLPEKGCEQDAVNHMEHILTNMTVGGVCANTGSKEWL